MLLTRASNGILMLLFRVKKLHTKREKRAFAGIRLWVLARQGVTGGEEGKDGKERERQAFREEIWERQGYALPFSFFLFPSD